MNVELAGMTAYSYSRFSRASQATGDSIRRQTKATEATAARHKLILRPLQADKGISARHGKNITIGALGEFLRMVKERKIETPAVLIVESLDRLTRQELRTATALFLNILDAGITIITTSPEYIYRHDSSDMTDIIIAVVILSRAYEESETKSKRLKEAWSAKRKKAIETRTATASNAPSWIKRDKQGNIHVDQEKKKTVQRIYQLRAIGYGYKQIMRTLNKEGVKPFGKKHKGRGWYENYIRMILINRTVLGEHQFTEGGKPTGEPVANYYPPIISQKLFDRVQEVNEAQKKHRGGQRTEKVTNLFRDRIFTNDHDPMVLGHRDRTPRLISSAAKRKVAGADVVPSFRLELVEQAFLTMVKELTVEDITPSVKNNDKADLEELAAQIKNDTRKMQSIKERMLKDEDCVPLIEVVRNLDSKITKDKQHLKQLENKYKASQNSTLTECQSIIELMDKANPEELYAIRLKLRHAIRQLVNEIHMQVWISKQDGKRYAHLLVNMLDGYNRTILICDQTTSGRYSKQNRLPALMASTDKYKMPSGVKEEDEFLYSVQVMMPLLREMQK